MQQVVALGPDVKEPLNIGQRVCVENHFYCGTCYQCTHSTFTVSSDHHSGLLVRLATHLPAHVAVWPRKGNYLRRLLGGTYVALFTKKKNPLILLHFFLL